MNSDVKQLREYTHARINAGTHVEREEERKDKESALFCGFEKLNELVQMLLLYEHTHILTHHTENLIPNCMFSELINSVTV